MANSLGLIGEPPRPLLHCRDWRRNWADTGLPLFAGARAPTLMF